MNIVENTRIFGLLNVLAFEHDTNLVKLTYRLIMQNPELLSSKRCCKFV